MLIDEPQPKQQLIKVLRVFFSRWEASDDWVPRVEALETHRWRLCTRIVNVLAKQGERLTVDESTELLQLFQQHLEYLSQRQAPELLTALAVLAPCFMFNSNDGSVLVAALRELLAFAIGGRTKDRTATTSM
jgi:hypothetical protein